MNLNKLFYPESIAVAGASPNLASGRLGAPVALRHLLEWRKRNNAPEMA